jgi:hypothetical protein
MLVYLLALSLASVPFDWERFVSAVGAPGALLLALGWFLARAWREFSPLVKAWLQSQLENDQVHRQAVRQLTARQNQLQLGHVRTHRALAHTAQAIEAACPADRHSEVARHTEAACRELAQANGE